MPDKSKCHQRLDNGCCSVCGTNKVENNSSTCGDCKERANIYNKNRRAERVAKGWCTTCGSNHPVSGLKTCQSCRDGHQARWKANKKKYSANNLKGRQKLRRRIIDHYGGKCLCCGESQLPFLTIDHINNDGAEHRRQLCKEGVGSPASFYRWLEKSGFPGGFQTLCYNCNIGKYKNGGICPHKNDGDGV